MSPTTRLIAVILVLLAAAGLAVVVVRARRTTAPTAAHTALTVTLTRPEQAAWPRSVQANGPLAAWQEAVVAAETGGLRISELLVDVGATVVRGQELARLADESVQADVAVARAQLAQSEAALTEATANAERARRSADGTLSEQQTTQYLTAERRVMAERAAAAARLANQELRLAQTRIRALDDGVVSARPAVLGAVVPAGSELFRLIRQGRIIWLAELDATPAAQMRPGLTAQVALPDGTSCAGTVELVEPAADPGTRLQRVRVALPTASGARAGWYARGTIALGDAPALHLPESALVLRDGRSLVFVCIDRERVEQRLVGIGRRQGDRVEITSGLVPGTDVVAAGGAFLDDGDRVQVQP
jgi:HlyD family secretion protein